MVVVNYGSSDLLETALLPPSADDSVLAIVVDNWTGQPEQDRVRELCDSHAWRFLPFASNIGFGAACNAGAEIAFSAECDLLLFLNPDARMTTASFQHLVAEAVQHPADMIAPVIERADGSLWFDGGTLDLAAGKAHHQMPASGRTEWLTGACLMMTAATFRRLGGFDSSYFLYWEDVDLCRRWQDLGGGLRVATGCAVIHDVGGTQGASGKSWSYLYYNMRNRLRFAHRRLGFRTFLRWSLNAPRYAMHLARVSGVKQKRTPLSTFASGTALGLAHGLAGIDSTGRK